MMKKKLISMLLALVLVIGVTVIGVSADEATHTNHCECGGNLTGAAQTAHAADCAVVETWTEVNTTNFKNGGIFSKPGNYLNFNESGYYYLTADVATGYVIEIKAGQEITICLNGHTLKSNAGSNSAIRLYGKLTICDCQGGGKVTAKTAKTAGLVNMLTTTSNQTVFNLYNGDLTMTDNDYTANAGVVQVANNTTNTVVFNMYGGSISGGTANKGGNVLIGSKTGIMNMYGGSITGGSVKTNDTSADRNRGGNIYVNLGTLNVYGGTISGGLCTAEDTNPAMGGDIYQNGGTVNLNTAFGVLDYANSGTGHLTLGESFSAENVICKSISGVPVKVAEGTEAQAKAFTAANSEYYVAYENGEMILKMIPVESIDLLYDDRKDLNTLVGAAEGATVTISDQVVTSKAVGTETADSNVLVYENGVLYAVGTGTAKLTVDGISYDVTVSPAPISLFMITGHSIGRGEKGNGAQSVALEAGQAYSTHRYHTYEDTGSAAIINPDELTDTTGLGYGSANRLTGMDAFAAGQGGTEGEGSALAWQWNQLTGEKVWVINAAVGGSCLNEWIPGAEGHNATYTYHYDTSVAAFKNAQAILDKEIAAGHYTLSHTAIIYHSAANFSYFADWTQELIEDYYDQMWNGYKTELGVEVMGLVPIWSAAGRNNIWNDKPANFYMAASAEYEDVFIASVITRNWMTASGLSSFPDITYTTQSAAVSKPTSVHHKDQGGTSTNSVFCSTDTTHLSQVTYNAQGIDIANNMYAYWNGDKTASSVELRTNRNALLGDTLELAVGENCYAVPMMDKVYANDLTIAVDGNITVNFPMHLVAEQEGTSTITVSQGDKVLKTLTVTVTAAHSHCVCGGYAEGVDGHTCQAVTDWTPWGDDYSETYTLPTTAGHYYLTKDMTVTNEYNIGENTEVYLCLNGYSITNSQTAKRVYNIYGKLNMCDCSQESDWGTISGSRCDDAASAVAGTFQLRDNKEGKTATVNLYSGILTSASPNVLMQGGVVQLGNAGTYGAVFNMYGGKIVGGNATNGGTVYIMKNSVFNLYGGEISDGTASERGGIFYIEGVNSQLNIAGGTVTGGSAKNGGNIYMNTDSAVTITGGTVTDGTANTDNGYGGNIRVNAGTLSISGVTISGGKAKYGGSLAVQGTAAITGSTIQTATGSRGRALYIDKAGQVTLNNCDIKNLDTAGTGIWILGKLILQGTVNMPDSDTLDLMVDAQKGTASIDISGLTGQDAPYGIRRWETDEIDDDPGLLATGASEAQLDTAFFAWRTGYCLSYAEGNIYLSNCNIQGMNAAGQVLSGFASIDEVMADTTEGVTYYLINADLSGGTVSRDMLLNLNGKHLTQITVNEGVTLSLIDTANDTYDAALCGSLSGTVNGTVTPIYRASASDLGAVKPYVVVYEDGKYSAHRYYVALTAVSLDPANDALGYKAAFKVDDVLKNYVTGYGFHLGVNGGSTKTYGKTAFESATLTLRLKNIMAANGGEMTINGDAFITFRTINGEEDTRKSASHATSMKETIQTVDAAWDTYTEEQQNAVKALCDKYTVTQTWELNNIYGVDTTEPEETVSEV